MLHNDYRKFTNTELTPGADCCGGQLDYTEIHLQPIRWKISLLIHISLL